MSSKTVKVFAATAGFMLVASAFAQSCATGPVTVGFLPKLDTDP